MINSQLPYNQLPLIDESVVALPKSVSEMEIECLRSLDFLNGYLTGLDEPLIQDYIDLLHYADMRNSLELEGDPVSISRIFEALCSENQLGDALLKGLIDYMSWFKSVRNLSLDTMKPSFLRPFRKNCDQLRERKEHGIKSYFTNLTLYTAPVQNNAMNALKSDLNIHLSDIGFQSRLQNTCLMHYQIRAIAPYNGFNGLMARAYTQLTLRLLGLNYDFVPLSSEILKNREQYQTLMRDIANDASMFNWIEFLLEQIHSAATKMPFKLRNIIRFKRKLGDMIDKYPNYNMPSDLCKILMKRPFVKAADIIKEMDCHRHSAYTYLDHLVRMGVLVEKNSGREKMYLNKELLDILSD